VVPLKPMADRGLSPNESAPESRFLGSLVGSGLGDAIGELAFGGLGEAALRAAITKMPVLTYTDDTAMAIGVAESIVQTGGLDEQHLGDTFRANFVREPWRGYAAGPPTIFSLVESQAVPYSQAARSLFGGQGSFGNGAAMRIAPVGLCFGDSPDLYDMARASASVTHAHPIGVDGAAVLARAVGEAVGLSPQEPFPVDDFCQGLIDFARTPEIRDKMVRVGSLITQEAPASLAARRLGRGVAVHESLPFAIYAFLRHPASFEGCLFCAILNGGDRDTLGAMACAISGAYLGIAAIPQLWRDKLENREHIEDLAVKLSRMGGE
jgi:poly(ADP-ribose) glycohydrolase ARH3